MADVSEQPLLERLRTRAAIRRKMRLARDQVGKDRISDLLDEAANEIETLKATVVEVWTWDHFR